MKLLRTIKIKALDEDFHTFMILRDCGFYSDYDFKNEHLNVYVINC